MLEFTLPIKTVSESNQREHWAKKAARVKKQRAAVTLLIPKRTLAHKREELQRGERVVIQLLRLSSRKLDDDNLRGALKAVRDQIAKLLGADDGSMQLSWLYEQEKCKRGMEAVRVWIL